MRRWEKKVLRTIRSEAANFIPTLDGSLGRENTSDTSFASIATNATNATWGRDDVARALLELTVENNRGGQRPAPGSPTGTQPSGSEGGGGAVATMAFVEGERTKVACDFLCNAGGQLPKPPSTAGGEGKNRQTLREPGRPPGQSGDGALKGEQGGDTIGVGGEGENAAANGHKYDENPDSHFEQEDGGLKNMAEKLLQTSSSFARAVARPLSMKPPPVLEVEKDPRQVRYVFLFVCCSGGWVGG